MIKKIHNKQHKALRVWLKSCRVEQNLSTRELAMKLEEPFQFVSKVERGERNLSVQEYVQYCEALNVDNKIGLEILTQEDADLQD